MNRLVALRPLASRQFATLWVAQLLSLVGQNLLNFALIIRVYQLASGTSHANLAVGAVVASFGISAVLFAPVAGALVDHWDRRQVMLVSNLLRAALAGCLLMVGDNLAIILLLTFLISTVTQFFTPAEVAAIPRLVESKDLAAANGIFITSFYASFVIGYAGAAPLIGSFGVFATLAIVVVCFGLAAAVVSLVRQLPVEGMQALVGSDLWRLPLREVTTNARLVLSQPALRQPMLQLTLVQGVLGSVLALAPALSLALLGQKLETGGYVLVVPAGIGLIVGVLLIGHLQPGTNKQPVLRLAVAGMGLSLVLMVASQWLVRTQLMIIAASLLMGVAMAAASVSGQTLLQEASADRNRGKVFGALQMLINLAQTVPVFTAAAVADRFGAPAVVGVLGGLTIMLSLLPAVRQSAKS